MTFCCVKTFSAKISEDINCSFHSFLQKLSVFRARSKTLVLKFAENYDGFCSMCTVTVKGKGEWRVIQQSFSGHSASVSIVQ
jgi:hypothetical protein